MTEIYNKRNGNVPNDAVYVGRPTPFGNPFAIGRDGNRQEVIAKFESMLINNDALMAKVKRELRGKDLVCWCAPEACHAEVLRFFANDYELER